MKTEYQHILVALDPKQEEQVALTRAILLAKQWQAKLTLFCCEFNPGLVAKNFLEPDMLEKAENALIDKRRQWLLGYSNSVSDQGIEVDVISCWGRNYYQHLIETANKMNCDFIIKGTHKHPALAKLFFNPADWQLLKSCAQPLLLAKEQIKQRALNVVVAIDVMADDEHALNKELMDQAIAFTETVGAVLHVVHSYQLLAWDMMQEVIDGMGGYYVGVDSHQEYIDKTAAHHRDKLLAFLEDFDVDLENVHLVEGEPEESIIDLTRELSAAFLLVGTTYRTGLLGSTAERILDNVECDVIAIKPPGFQAPEF